LQKLELNKLALESDLDSNWELLAEPIQMVMRKYGIEKPYEKLKELTRGKQVSKSTISQFIDGLKIPAIEKKKLKLLSPSRYIGFAVELVDSYKPLFF
jgi:adenylosuccinate lyase